MHPRVLATLTLLAAASIVASEARADLGVEVTETGFISVSADGAGTNSPAGVTISVEKLDSGATVRKAVFACASVLGATVPDGAVSLDNNAISWDISFTNATSFGNFNNVYADVTSIVKPKVDAAPTGLVDFLQDEVTPTDVDGCGLWAVLDDPSQTTQNTVFVLFGGQSPTGDSFEVNLGRALGPGDRAEFGLAISFGAQDQFGPAGSNLCGTDSDMFSEVTVNGTRLTSCAGNLDDGTGNVANGTLITVGGIGDDTLNPDKPFQTPLDGDSSRTSDDELYDLTTVLGPADTKVSVNTLNPSNDDNIFGGFIFVTAPATIGTSSDCVLGVDKVRLADRAVVPGSIASYGTTELGVDALSGSITSDGNVFLRNFAEVDGDVDSTGSVNTQFGATVTGTTTANAASVALPTIPPTSTPAYPGGWTAVNSGSSLTLTPSTYGNVVVNSNATLVLDGMGDYGFAQLIVNSGATLVYDEGSSIFVDRGITWRGTQSGIGPLPVSQTGSGWSHFEADYDGAVIAPNANVRFAGNGGTFTGASFVGKSILIETDALVECVSP